MIDRLLDLYRAAADDFKYQGLTVVLWKILARMVRPVAEVELHFLFDFDLTQPIAEHRARVDADYRIDLAEEADLPGVVDLQVMPPPPVTDEILSDAENLERAQVEQLRAEGYRRFLEAMQAGEICFLFRIGDELVHFNWMRFSTCANVTKRPVDLGPDEIYMTDGITAEHWRGRGVHPAVNAHMLRYAQGRGLKRAWTITDMTKGRSRHGLYRLGWHRRGQVLYVTPRNRGRTFMLRLGGNVEPLFRQARRDAAAR